MANFTQIQEVTEENNPEVWAALQPPPIASVPAGKVEMLREMVAESAYQAEVYAGGDVGNRPTLNRELGIVPGDGNTARNEGRAEAYRIVEGFIISLLQ